jgi:hypothetical protein
MKFSDLFLPKIARSDPNVRLKAVQKAQDPAVLKKVMNKDSDKKVREAASRRLKEIKA